MDGRRSAGAGPSGRIRGDGVAVAQGPGGVTIAGRRAAEISREPALWSLACNVGSAALRPYDACALAGHLYGGLNAEFHRCLTVRVPAAGDEGRFGVCAEAIPAGGVGRVYVLGVCLATIVNQTGSPAVAAEVTDGEAHLVAAEDGSAQVLWEAAFQGDEEHLALVRIGGGGAGEKALATLYPCRLATTAHHSLSGLAAIDGIQPYAGDKILVWKQSSPTQNGIYTAASGAWKKERSFAVSDPLLIMVRQGTLYGRMLFMVTGGNAVAMTGAAAR
ncbi:MAG: hypothetical protein N3A38_07640 [Planctomycetota bacterium]|nr:hypothetical protein [Planctomycetota bacterium]